jgi:uncharacterized membrane protein
VRADQWLLFGHLVGVLTLFAAIALENVILVYLLRARTVEELRSATTFAPLLPRMFPIGVVLIVGFGIGLVAHSDEFRFGQAWIDLAFGLVIVLAVMSPTVHGRRTDRITADARSTSEGPIPEALAAKVRDPVLRTGVFVSSWLAFSIVLLMARQPDWPGSWIIIVVFGLIGVSESLIVGRMTTPVAAGPTLH